MLQSKHLYIQSGFSTLEMLLAFAVIILSLSTVVLLVFGSQNLMADGQANEEALSKAGAMREVAAAEQRQNFPVISPTQSQDANFTLSAVLQTPDPYTKQLSDQAEWSGEGRNQGLQLATLVTDYAEEDGTNTCDPNPSGDWTKPQIKNFDFSQLINNPGGYYPISSLDAYHGKLYVTVSDTATKTTPTLFVFDISNPIQPILTASVDNDTKVSAGLQDIIVVDKYAYAASASSYTRGQLQIFDISHSPQVVSTYKVPIINSGGGSKGLGNSIFYSNGKVYLGLTKTESEQEFNIIDVASSTAAVFKGGYAIGNGVNDLAVRGDYAYIAHPTSASSSPQEQLTVLNISDATMPYRVSGFYDYGAIGGNGKSVYLDGDALYLGRTASKISGTTDFIPELYALDVSRLTANLSSTSNASLATAESANGVVRRGSLVFVLANTQLQILNSSNFSLRNSLALPLVGQAMDCEGNYIYAASASTSGASFLSIVSPGP